MTQKRDRSQRRLFRAENFEGWKERTVEYKASIRTWPSDVKEMGFEARLKCVVTTYSKGNKKSLPTKDKLRERCVSRKSRCRLSVVRREWSGGG